MASWENYHDVLSQMAAFGIVMRPVDLQGFPKRIDRKITCGKGGKYWYSLHEYTRDNKTYLTGSYGGYNPIVGWQKVEVAWAPLSDAERARFRAEREAAQAKASAERAKEVANAVAQSIDIWRRTSRTGSSPYLVRKGLDGESCHYLTEQMILRWPGMADGEDDTVVRLEGGTLLVPLIRYDYPRDSALRGLQFIKPDGTKIYQRGFEKPGCCVRLGELAAKGEAGPRLLLVCEGYATGLSLRMGTDRAFPVFVAFDAGNLGHVVPLLRSMFPLVRLLICADDDWKTFDKRTGQLTNPGRTTAKKVAKETAGCDLVWPVFAKATRQDKDTDFDDLRQREGLHTVRRQLHGVIEQMGKIYG